VNSTFKAGSKALIVINPVAGFINPELMKRTCEQQFHAAGWRTTFCFTQKDKSLVDEIQKAVHDGVDLVVAVGGDGTIALVAAGLVNTNVPLGIIPAGTWNAIARHLYLPASPIRAIELMTGKHTVRKLDMMAVGNTVHAMNIGVGFSAKMNSGANRAEKRKMGILAYFRHFFKLLFGLEMPKYVIDLDGNIFHGRATEIFIANYGIAGLHLLDDSLDIHPDDGKVDVLLMQARTILDLPILIWHMFIKKEKRTPKYRQLSARKSLVIYTSPVSPVQGDGDLIGTTPIRVKVMPRSILVIAP
jgi:diacylglycerol kinase family enzyme